MKTSDENKLCTLKEPAIFFKKKEAENHKLILNFKSQKQQEGGEVKCRKF